jgi:hypothetical protein
MDDFHHVVPFECARSVLSKATCVFRRSSRFRVCGFPPESFGRIPPDHLFDRGTYLIVTANVLAANPSIVRIGTDSVVFSSVGLTSETLYR